MDDNSAAGSDPSSTLLIPENTADALDGQNNTGAAGGIESPISPSSTNVLARFEFETGRGNEGSKVLMVEWDCSHTDGRELCAQDREGWIVSWEHKSAAYSLSDNEKSASPVLRVYFLLPENAPIPPAVTISHSSTGRTLTTKCMPAIFAPGLGVSPPDSGKRGVLHTIWAKKRLSELQEEIGRELQVNSEGVALEMAIQEKEWLIDHFGFVDLDTRHHPAPPPTPQSPRSPVGGRLGEMLKGLKLSTSPLDLVRTPGTTPRQASQPFPRGALNTVPTPNLSIPKPGSSTAVASLDAVIGNTRPVEPISQTRDIEDELFALPMSPRSSDKNSDKNSDNNDDADEVDELTLTAQKLFHVKKSMLMTTARAAVDSLSFVRQLCTASVRRATLPSPDGYPWFENINMPTGQWLNGYLRR
ncbi:hypothetical protein NUW58_g1631 [Xylaria curta]|uniref:Uncharacterized protein n=1 Tax=Xylaria curta TaxID=42375 RepID=A0ACC1PJA3_9PEZI|nr:hypothetical protein NUW58_g1631 [Xylaria curta]